MHRFICIHGHFNQPPRENPWLDSVEQQPSASPFHNWNQRITAECYAPMTKAHLLDDEGRILGSTNNFARMSFSFGPCLLRWMERAEPETYQAILRADRESLTRFDGHGTALAQAYTHAPMPLLPRREKEAQLAWGLRDFELRFGRPAEGVWLPEGIADEESLEILCDLGARFVLLDPRRDGPDSRRAYLCHLPSGREIHLFFFDGSLSRAVTMEQLLTSPDRFYRRVREATKHAEQPQLANLVLHGEQLGHLVPRGEEVLAKTLERWEDDAEVELTTYGQFLELAPPEEEITLREPPAHLLVPDSPVAALDSALTELREGLSELYRERAADLLREPEDARNRSLDLDHDRSAERLQGFLREHGRRDPDESERVLVRCLFEMMREALLTESYSGWIHEPVFTPESLHLLPHAARSVQLAETVEPGRGARIEEAFAERLGEIELPYRAAPDEEFKPRTGAELYHELAVAARPDWERVAAHYAVRSLFESFPEEARFHCYTAHAEEMVTSVTGRARLLVGRVHLASVLTGESARMTFAFIHFGEHLVNGGVRPAQSAPDFELLAEEARTAFEKGDFPEVIRIIDRNFAEATYSLRSLFRDEQQRILQQVLHPSLAEIEHTLRRLKEDHVPTTHFLSDIGAPMPRVFELLSELVLGSDLNWKLTEPDPDPESIEALFREAEALRVEVDLIGLEHRLGQAFAHRAGRWRERPEDAERMLDLMKSVKLAHSLHRYRITIPESRDGPRRRAPSIDLRPAQDVWLDLRHDPFPEKLRRFVEGESGEARWLEDFITMGQLLGAHVSELQDRLDEAKSMPSAEELVDELMTPRQPPLATYRFQFNAGFTFRDALARLPYLRDLGVSHCYASPILKARSGSGHGYDITDHSQLNPELGGAEAFEEFSEGLREHGLKLMLDTVPNHMGIGPDNPWWMDVLENGPSSVHADHFDISWDPVNPNIKDKILLPILEAQFGDVLEQGLIRLVFEAGGFHFEYHDHRWPVAPGTYPMILEKPRDVMREELGEEDDAVLEMESILTALGYLPPRDETDPEKVRERNREKEKIKERLAALVEVNETARRAVEDGVAEINGAVGEPASFDRLDELVEAQAYRPAFWRVATEEINYRRFFDINDLAAVRVEVPQVFESAHKLILGLLAEGKAHGLRIDHPDGLWQPADYFMRLQTHFVLEKARRKLAPKPLPGALEQRILALVEDRLQARAEPPLYVLAEKILCEGEDLPRDWAIDGTTGYELLNLVGGLLVMRENRETFQRIHSQFLGHAFDFEELTNRTKKMIMHVSMASEINALSHDLDRISERNRRYRDFTLNSLTFVIREILACLPVYRTYITEPSIRVKPGGEPEGHLEAGHVAAPERDREHIERAVREAKKRNPRTDVSVFNFVRDVLLLDCLDDFAGEDRPLLVAWTMKFQQVSGPIMAKGVEDTALYIYNRLTSLNEVGNEPDHFGTTVAQFHKASADRMHHWPHALLATSTHDTKRSEDTRARLHVLSELPEEWKDALDRWHGWNFHLKHRIENVPAPDRNDEYLLYQTLLGVWPVGLKPDAEGMDDFRARIRDYMTKATKEAKTHTSWVNANEDYDRAVRELVDGVLGDPESEFLADLVPFAERLAYFGYFGSLSQVLLKITAPGAPDFYQGTELWDYSLVDPDNRRPVDYDLRQRYLSELREAEDRVKLCEDLVERIEDGRIKLHMIHRALRCRGEHPELFEHGDYLPVEVTGSKAKHVCAFVRRHEGRSALVVVPRLVATLLSRGPRPPLGEDVWEDTAVVLPEGVESGSFVNAFTGSKTDSLRLGDLIRQFPVFLGTREN